MTLIHPGTVAQVTGSLARAFPSKMEVRTLTRPSLTEDKRGARPATVEARPRLRLANRIPRSEDPFQSPFRSAIRYPGPRAPSRPWIIISPGTHIPPWSRHGRERRVAGDEEEVVHMPYQREEGTGGPGRLVGRAGRWFRRRLRKTLFRVLPREAVYHRVRTTEFYSRDYFDRKKDPLRESGYGEALTYREEFREVADVALHLFQPQRVLDLGCAKGFQVLALRREGIDAWGIDISDYAVSKAPAEVEPFLKVEEYRRVHFPDEYFDLVLAMEVLEHVPPTEIREVVDELRRLTSRFIWATIPCYGSNPYGPDGCLEGKIQSERISYYQKHVVDLASFRHLVRDIEGYPIHGHLIAASFDWWTALFTSMGFLRRGDLEMEINRRLRPAAEGTWNCLVFEKAQAGPGGRARPGFLEGLEFQSSGNGSWKAYLPALTIGIHHLDLELRVQWMNWRKPDEDRLLCIRCLSPQEDRIYGMRLVTYGEARKRKKGRLLPAEISLSIPRETDALLEVIMADESRVQPLRLQAEEGASRPQPVAQEPV